MRHLITSSLLRDSVSVLEPSTPISLDIKSTVADAIHVMKEHRIGCVLIIDDAELVGIFSERDILTKALGRGMDHSQTQIVDVMTGEPECLHYEDSVGFALNKMSVGSFRHIPLVDTENRPVGLISAKDIFRYLVS
ncbi:MAG: CBS domain-containing protein [Planctomycetota bacterium]|jgi:CBS domain-containing protein|nr:CBS domain-containing protein [Planctomycetota bacterium]MDP7132250.1 CBS domain-containing protein [Planctomycetota bacterium]MDP7249555.1 CBS domain-containing protein [Planctomycetota bacterium]